MPFSLTRWFDDNILELGREMRLSYLPPLMVYLAAGISSLTGIVGTFFVKEYLGLSAAFLAALGFWAGLPWALKMPVGHLVDLLWRYKSALVFVGAALIAASLLVMLGLVTDLEGMRAIMPAERWYVVGALLAPIGYMLQDTVADAMTVEAVPIVDDAGRPVPAEQRRLMNTTVQTLGRVAIIGGGVLVSLVNVVMFHGVEKLPQAAKAAIYAKVYTLALVIPAISVLGVLLAWALKRRTRRRLAARGLAAHEIAKLLEPAGEATRPNWSILGGSLAFVALSIGLGASRFEYAQEAIFAGSFAVIAFLMYRLLGELTPESRRTLLGTAIVIFVFRALPGPGAGSTWWMIDALGFDQSFLARLGVIGSTLTLVGLFAFRRLMAERSIAYIVAFLTLAGFVLGLPILGMYYGLHEWTARLTGGLVDARFIALVDTALESPLGQISMVPLLAWIANSAPARLKATYFAVMASFTNLALSAAQLGTKYLNVVFTVTREVRDPVTHAVTMPADYSELGLLLVTATAISLVAPLLAIALTRRLGLGSA
ncbi:MAG: hypothetical protein HY749_12250 [Gammaproteobacteria bacterium]|nr:hypothetical protein [Gammaproteobacteria bacterium]MBI5616157.1 hypothetical protein [Gammaproteobacteria bacterium]